MYLLLLCLSKPSHVRHTSWETRWKNLHVLWSEAESLISIIELLQVNRVKLPYEMNVSPPVMKYGLFLSHFAVICAQFRQIYILLLSKRWSCLNAAELPQTAADDVFYLCDKCLMLHCLIPSWHIGQHCPSAAVYSLSLQHNPGTVKTATHPVTQTGEIQAILSLS